MNNYSAAKTQSFHIIIMIVNTCSIMCEYVNFQAISNEKIGNALVIERTTILLPNFLTVYKRQKNLIVCRNVKYFERQVKCGTLT